MKGILLAALIALPASGQAQHPSFTVALDRVDVSVGDHVTATYSAMLPAGARVEFEALVTPAVEGASSGPALDFQPLGPEKLEKNGAWSRTVSFAPFVAGPLNLPGPHLIYVSPSGERIPVRPPATTLNVTSRLPQDKKPEELSAKPDRPVRVPARGLWFWGPIAAGALLVAGLVYWLVKRSRRRPVVAAPEVPPIAPGVELLQALSVLEKQAGDLQDDPRGFYSELTRVVKRYLERRLELPVLEWTTFETIRRLRERDLEMPKEIGLNELLSNADRVKFGKGRATRDEARLHVGRARHLHDHVEARLAPRAEPPPAQAPSRRERAS
jgi:hypothetical protein